MKQIKFRSRTKHVLRTTYVVMYAFWSNTELVPVFHSTGTLVLFGIPTESGRNVPHGGPAEGCACLSEERRSETRQTKLTGHAEGRACLSVEQGSEIWQTNRTGHAEGCACLSEEQHAENGAHHLNFLLLNHFSSNFEFVITYHAARQINERPCHLLSHAVHNSKLTTLPQSQRR